MITDTGQWRWLICVFRLSNTHLRAILEGTTDMRRCESHQMLPLPPKCSEGLTALKTNTLTAWGTAEQKLSTHIGPETGMEVRQRLLRVAWVWNEKWLHISVVDVKGLCCTLTIFNCSQYTQRFTQAKVHKLFFPISDNVAGQVQAWWFTMQLNANFDSDEHFVRIQRNI